MGSFRLTGRVAVVLAFSLAQVLGNEPNNSATNVRNWDETGISFNKSAQDVPAALREYAAGFRLVCRPENGQFTANEPIRAFVGVERVADPRAVRTDRRRVRNPFTTIAFPTDVRLAAFNASGDFERWVETKPESQVSPEPVETIAIRDAGVGLLMGERRGRFIEMFRPGELSHGKHRLVLIARGRFFLPNGYAESRFAPTRAETLEPPSLGGLPFEGRYAWDDIEVDRSTVADIEILAVPNKTSPSPPQDDSEVSLKWRIDVVASDIKQVEGHTNGRWTVRLTMTNMSTRSSIVVVDPFGVAPTCADPLAQGKSPKWTICRAGGEKQLVFQPPIVSRTLRNDDDFVLIPPGGEVSGFVYLSRTVLSGEYEFELDLEPAVIADPKIQYGLWARRFKLPDPAPIVEVAPVMTKLRHRDSKSTVRVTVP